MSDPFSSVAGVECVIGVCTTTTAKVGVCSLRGGTPTLSLSPAGTVAVGAWTDLGADNAGESGKHVCSVATLTISGLSPGTRYTGTLTCDSISISISFRTHPVDGSVFSFAAWSCERMTDIQYHGPAPWRRLKEDIQTGEGNGAPVLFTACVDDPCYAQLVNLLEDPASGLSMSHATDDAHTTELEWDYAMGWLNWFGLVKDEESAQAWYPERLWVRHNCSHIVMWGDNEVDPNHARDGQVSNRKVPRTDPWWSTAKTCYQRMCADHCSPESLGVEADTGFAWAFTIGDAAFSCPDPNSHCLPYNSEDTGDSHEYGPNTYGNETATGTETFLTRTEIGHSPPYAPPNLYGVKQVNAILEHHYTADKPVNVLFAPQGLTFENEPWHDLYPDECKEFFARGKEFVYNGDFRNVDDGWTTINSGITTAYHYNRQWQNCVEVENGASNVSNFYQEITGLEVGETYTVSGVKIAGAGRVLVGPNASSGALLNHEVPGGTEQAFSETFVADATNAFLTLRTDSGVLGIVARWDKISVTGPGGVPGVLNNPRMNGTTGCAVLLKGDTHSARVIRYDANGTTGFCEEALAEGTIYEIGMGTLTGSGSHRDATGSSINAGGSLRWEQFMNGETLTPRVSSHVLCTVRDSALEVQQQVNYLARGKYWSAKFAATGGNVPERIRSARIG